MGRSFPLSHGLTNGRNRRILVIAGRSGQGPLTEPTAAARPSAAGTARVCWLPSTCIVEPTTCALARRLRTSWMEARVTKVARVRQGSRNPWRHAGFARTRIGEGALD
jgi:hypothetical protein